MSKNVAAINIASREQFGESQYLSKYSNQLVELMKPVALQANKSLYGEQYQAIANRFQALVSAKVIDEATAEKLTNSSFEMYMNPYNTIANGNTFQKMIGINTYANGDIDNPASWIENVLSGINYSYGVAGDDTMNQSIMYNAWGIPVNGRDWNNTNYDKAMNKLASINNLSEKELEELFNNTQSKADDYNTTTDKINKAILNATTWIGDIKTIISDKGWAIGEVIVNGITTFLGAKLISGSIGKLASSLLGGGAGGTALSGTALGSALGVTAAVTLPIAIAASVGKLSEYFNKKDVQKEGEKWALEHYGEKGSENALYTNLMGEIKHSENNNKNGGALWSSFAWMWNNTVGRIGGGTHDTKNYLNIIRNESDMDSQLGNNAGMSTQDIMLAYYVAADRAGQLGELGWTNAELKESLQLFGYDNHKKLLNFLNTYLPILEDRGLMPKTTNGAQMTTKLVTNDQWLKDHYYRYGLSEVPYDNYMASLHEGEAVLTASTANELRNLLDEYRNNNQASANLEAVIGQQTMDLCNKLDEVIMTISRLNIGTGVMTTSSIDQAKAQGLLKNSMLHMTSTKNALN